MTKFDKRNSPVFPVPLVPFPFTKYCHETTIHMLGDYLNTYKNLKFSIIKVKLYLSFFRTKNEIKIGVHIAACANLTYDKSHNDGKCGYFWK